MDQEIPLTKLAEDSRTRLRASMMKFRPTFLAFTSKTAGQRFLGGLRSYGKQLERIGETRIWILPSTSGAANGSWRPEVWHRFADEVRATCHCRA
jgi:TDG/mug DNA glycosylase family protein